MGYKKKLTVPVATNDDTRDAKRLRQDEASSSGCNNRLLASNPFGSLRANDGNPSHSQQKQHPATPRQGHERKANQPSIPTKERVPPLFTTSKDVAAIRTDLAAIQIHPLFKHCLTGTKISCSTFADYDAVGKYLQGKKCEFYTHEAPGNKPMKVIIRGLMKHEPTEIVEELKAAKLKPIQVFPIRRADDREYRDYLYLVHLEKGSISMGELLKVKALFQTIVEWERYRPKKKDVTQCTNCLMFGHGARNCFMVPRCGKCAEPHLTASCQLMDEETEPKCANCGANHEGNNRQCPKRAEFLVIRKKASTRNQRRERQPPPPPPANDEHFPKLRYHVPNLPPLQPHRQPPRQPASAGHRQSVQDRFAVAAATPLVAPGWANFERRTPTTDPLDDGTLFPTRLMSEFAVSLFERLLACRSKRDQITAVCDTVEKFMDKYGP